MIAVSMSGRASGIKAEHRTTRPRSKQIRRMSLRFLLPACFALACFALALGGPAIAWAQQSTTPPESAPPALSPAEARRALSVLQDPEQRARLIETLQPVPKPAGPASAPAAPPAEPTAARKAET